MKKKALSTLLLVLLLFTTSRLHARIRVSGSPRVIVVPDLYLTIQEAINNANPGDTISVKSGVYLETLIVENSISIIGAGSTVTTIDGGGTPTPVVSIWGDHAVLTGFTVTGGWRGVAISASVNVTLTHNAILNNVEEGLRLEGAEEARVTQNEITQNGGDGIICLAGSDNVIAHNTVTLNSENGFSVYGSHRNTIENNTITLNQDAGLYVDYSEDNVIVSNNILDNGWTGLVLDVSQNCQLRSNVLTGNRINFGVNGLSPEFFRHDIDSSNKVQGKTIYYLVGRSDLRITPLTYPDVGFLALIDSTKITVEDLALEDNMQGVLISGTDNSTLRNVTTSQNYYGIFLIASTRNTIHSNTIAENFWGIYAINSGSNWVFHNNFLESKIRHFYDYYSNSLCIWDSGHPIGGNYWDDYLGDDSDKDGIGDSAKKIDSKNTDQNPLVGTFHAFATGLGSEVNIVTNSTIERFQYFESNNTIRIQVGNSTTDQAFGFLRVGIPYTVMNGVYEVTIEGASPLYWNDTLFDNGTHRWLYFTYDHSSLDIVITPEFQSLAMIVFLLMATLIVATIRSRRRAG